MLNFWLTRKGAFKSIATNKVFRRSFEGIIQSGFGLLSSNIGLILGDILGSFANIISGIYQAKKNGFSIKVISTKKIKSSLKRYRGFPKYQALPAILNTTSILLPVFLINKYFSPETVGFFDLSRQILAVPIAFITASLSQVLLKDYSDKVKKGNPLMRGVLKTSLLLTLGMIPFVVAIVFWGQELFSFVFSSTWKQSGIYSAILVPAFAIQFIVSPLSISFTVLEKLKTLAIWQILYFGSILSLILFKDLSIEKFLLLYTIINLSAYLIYYFLILSICKKYDNSL